MKRTRQYTDNDAGRAIDRDDLIQCLPGGHGAREAFADNGHRGGRPILVGQKIATSGHVDSEQPEEARGHLRTAQHSRLVAQPHREITRVVALEGEDASGARAPVEQRRIRCGASFLGPSAYLGDLHQATGLRIRQRFHQRGI